MIEVLKDVLPVSEVRGWVWKKAWAGLRALARWCRVEWGYWRYHRSRLSRRAYRRELALTRELVGRMGG